MARSIWSHFRGTFKTSSLKYDKLHTVKKTLQEEVALCMAQGREHFSLPLALSQFERQVSMMQSCYSLQHDMIDRLKKKKIRLPIFMHHPPANSP